MTLEEIKKEAEALSFDEKGRLAAFLVQLRNRENPDYLTELRRRIEDPEREHWLTPDEFEARLDAENKTPVCCLSP